MNKSLNNKSGKYLLLLLCCGFFSINALPLNPAYLVGFVLLFIIGIFIFSRARINRFSLWTIVFALLMGISQFVGIYYKSTVSPYPEGANYLTPLLFIYSILISVGVNEVFPSLDKKDRIKCYKNAVFLFCIFMIIELIIRIIIRDSSEGILYAFKKSLFYFDSNFTGLVDLAFLGFMLFLMNNRVVHFKKSKYLVYMLTFLTMSRAAIITLFAVFYVFKNKNKIITRSMIIFFAIIIVFCVMTISYLFEGSSYSSIDGSFNSKFYIINKALEYYQTQTLFTHFFGIGLGNTEQVIGIFAHNIYVTFVMEYGIVGTFLFLLYLIFSINVTKGNALYIWLPMLISGISLFSAYSPFLFILNAVIYNETLSLRRDLSDV